MNIEDQKNNYRKGQELIKCDFKQWFTEMYKILFGDCTMTKWREKLLECYDEVYKGEKRILINISDSFKTTISAFFMAYCFAKYKGCHFLYVSFSKDILSRCSEMLKFILTSEFFKDAYYSNIGEIISTCNNNNVEYNKHSSLSKDSFHLSGGGIVNFVTIFSRVFCCSACRIGIEGFTGCVIVDEPNNPNSRGSKINSVNYVFDSSIVTRMAPIVVMQYTSPGCLTEYIKTKNIKYKYYKIYGKIKNYLLFILMFFR